MSISYSKTDIILVYSGSQEDNSFLPFVPDIYYHYLSQNSLANSYFAYYPKTKKSVLYYPSMNSQWEDDYTRLNLKTSIPQKPIKQLVKDLFSYTPKKIMANPILSSTPLYQQLQDYFTVDLESLPALLNTHRELKSTIEINKLKEASRINSILFRDIIKNTRSYKNEKDILNDYDCKLNKINRDATYSYLPIVSNSRNNAIIHYTYNKKPILVNSLILMDVGCRLDGYSSDVTRTFPSSGKFTKEQKDIYSIVLDCYKFAVSNLREGSSFIEVEKNMRLLMYNKLVEIGLVKGTKRIKDQLKITDLFMPHLLGHSIGLEVHDVPRHLDRLEENMVITIEPGIYFGENIPSTNKYWKVGGIRIEDVFLVKKDGLENLVDVPIEIEEIEKLIQ